MSSAHTRATCMQAMCKVADTDAGNEDEATRALSTSFTLVQAALHPLNPPTDAKRRRTNPEEQTAEPTEAATNQTVEGSDSEVASDCSAPASADSEEDENFHWLLPRGGKTNTRIHRASGLEDDSGSAIPRCREASGGAFAWGYEEGWTRDTAVSTGRKWCTRCFGEM